MNHERSRILLLLLEGLLLFSLLAISEGFQSPLILHNNPLHQETTVPSTLLVLHSTSPQKVSASAPTRSSRRKVLLSRNGPYFHLDRASGKIEFGSTAKLVTKLGNKDEPNNADDLVAEWLSDERGLALSIWDERMMKEIRRSVYRLQTMKLQFVTIQLAPTVDVKMQTRYVNNDPKQPVFLLQSVGFDPNVSLLPGITMSAQELGIEIEVSGELRPTATTTTQGGDVVVGVSGRIAFQTSGNLPPPLRILPESVLRAATDSINQAVVNFAIKSFQKGATAKYNEFLQTKKRTTPPKPPQ